MSRNLNAQDLHTIQRLRNGFKNATLQASSTQETKINIWQSSIEEIHTFLSKSKRIKSIKIVSYQIIPKSEYNKQEYTTYQIEIITQEFLYKIKKRFKEFYQFYKIIKKYLHLKSSFPKKNYNPFVSSISQNISKQRIAKLNLFIAECFLLIENHCPNQAINIFYNFFEIRQNFMRNSYKNPYQKSKSDKIAYECYTTVKSGKSFNNKSNFLCENNIEMKIILLNQSKIAKNIITDIQDYIKQKRSKICIDDIKTIILGFDEYKGLLRYGLNNTNEINRIMALQLLSNIFSTQKQLCNQKGLKVLQKIPSNELLVQNISYFDNSQFKLNYFKILRQYCQMIQKQTNKSQNHIIKDLFLFHQELYNDYYHYKKISSINFNIEFNNLTIPLEKEKPSCKQEAHKDNFCDKIDINDFEDDSEQDNFVVQKQGNVTLFIIQAMNIIFLCFQSQLKIDRLKETMLKWNRYEQNLTFDDFSQKIRSVMTVNNRKFYLKIKISQNLSEQKIKSPIFECLNSIQDLRKEFSERVSTKIVKIYEQIEGETDYRQEIFFRQDELTTKVLIGIECPLLKQITNYNMRQIGHIFRQDLQKMII